MGNSINKKSAASPFLQDEQKMLDAAYRNACGSSDKVTYESFVENWSQTIERTLAISTAQFLFAPSIPGEICMNINLLRFADPYLILDRGTVDKKVQFLLSSMEKVTDNSFNIKELEQYIYIIIKSFMRLESTSERSHVKAWQTLGYTATERSLTTLAKGLVRTLSKNIDFTMPIETLGPWVQTTPQFTQMWREVFLQTYARHGGNKKTRGKDFCEGYIIPELCDIPNDKNYRPIIEIPHIIYINTCIPNEKRHKWRFLFSSQINGESFSTMLGKIQYQGSTVIIVEDEDQYIFGGFATDSWELSPKFTGTNNSMLFTLSPAIRCFTASGYNDHYQYLNLNKQTMPNGLGMGGQFDYWGLFIDCMFNHGQSVESCTTFQDYVQLSKRKQFRIRNLEVWGVGDLPKAEDSDEETTANEKSVLDNDERYILSIAGKTMHSDGLREPNEND